MRVYTHSGPLSSRFERYVERAKAESRAADLSRRLDAREAAIGAGLPVRQCSGCGVTLLPGEAAECRHCDAGKPRTDTE